jgi:hypothetical protein
VLACSAYLRCGGSLGEGGYFGGCPTNNECIQIAGCDRGICISTDALCSFCENDDCEILESFPAQVACTSGSREFRGVEDRNSAAGSGVGGAG